MARTCKITEEFPTIILETITDKGTTNHKFIRKSISNDDKDVSFECLRFWNNCSIEVVRIYPSAEENGITISLQNCDIKLVPGHTGETIIKVTPMKTARDINDEFDMQNGP